MNFLQNVVLGGCFIALLVAAAGIKARTPDDPEWATEHQVVLAAGREAAD